MRWKPTLSWPVRDCSRMTWNILDVHFVSSSLSCATRTFFHATSGKRWVPGSSRIRVRHRYDNNSTSSKQEKMAGSTRHFSCFNSLIMPLRG